MPRGLHVDTVAELEKDGQYIFHMSELLLDAGTLRYTNAHKDISFDGDTYIASGNFIGFGNVVETQRLEISSMSIQLSGVDLTSLATALLDDVVNRRINLYQGLIDPDTYAVIADPLLTYSGLVKGFTFRENPGGTSALSLATASVFADFDRTTGRRSNHQDQETYLAARSIAGVDLGFEFAHISTADLKWGRV